MSKLTINHNDSLYYEFIDGDKQLPYLVFLHEGLGCTRMWKGFPAQLCQMTGCPGLVFDRLGYGESSVMTGKRTIHYLHDAAINELPQVLNALLPGTPIILVGHSDGASISLIYGAGQPGQLKGIISEAAHVFVEGETTKGIQAVKQRWQENKLTALNKYHGDNTAQVFNAWADTWLAPGFKHWNIEYLLPSIEVPLLLLQGMDDQFASDAQIRSIAEHTGGQCELHLLEQCAHIPHFEAASRVLHLMSDFIKHLTPVSGSHNKKLPRPGEKL